MSNLNNGNERVYQLQLGTLIRQAISYGIMTFLSLVVTIFVISDRSIEMGWTIGLGIFLGLVTFTVFALFYDVVSRMPTKQRIALGVSDAGLRIPDAKKTVAPDEIKAVYIMTHVSIGASSNNDVNSIARVNIPHIRVMRYGGDPFTGSGPDARCYMIAYEDQLFGGRDTFTRLCRDLVDWGKVHKVRVAFVEGGQQEIYEAVGAPAVAQWYELDYLRQPASNPDNL